MTAGSAGSRAERPRWLVVAWAPYSRRSEMFARELGGELHCISFLTFQRKLHAPLRYLLQAVATLRLLVRERPAAVHVQNPPNFCALVVHLYCRLFGARYVIEHHSAAFDPVWRFLTPLTRYIVRKAQVNIVTSDHWADLVTSWGGTPLVMHDPYLDLPEGRPYPLAEGFDLAVLATFAPDEPVDEVLTAAADLPDVNVYITGAEHKRLENGYRPAPDNVTFTGFLDSNGEYLGLIRGVDAALVLTTRDHTLQLAGCEALAVGTPLITSDFDYLRGLFHGGTLFVPNTAEGIRKGIEEMVDRCAELRAEVPEACRRGRSEWEERMGALEAMVWPEGLDTGDRSAPDRVTEHGGSRS